MTKRRDLSWLYLIALALLPLLFYWRVLTPNSLDRGSFPAGDFADQFYAFARFAFAELSQGRLPLWNPYTFAGHPFIADIQSAVFYPPSLLVMAAAALAGGFSLYALEWQAVLHFSLAGVFTFLFARRELAEFVHGDIVHGGTTGQKGTDSLRQIHRSQVRPSERLEDDAGHHPGRHIAAAAAFIAALVFVFGGYLTAYPSQQLAILETDVWLPLVLWCISVSLPPMARASAATRGVPGPDALESNLMAQGEVRSRPGVLESNLMAQGEARSRPGTLLAGLFLGVAVLAGHPQSLLFVLVVTLAYLVFQGRRRGLGWRALALRALAMLGVAFGVSAIQWLPSLEFMQLSSRSSLTYDDYARGFELQDPLQVLLPGAVSVYSPLYVGIVPLALAICALWLPRRPKRAAIFWLGLALFALALSFGGNLFLYPILYLFAPGFALFRQQERAAFIFSFALALLAGYGACYLGRALPADARQRLRGVQRLSLAALCGAAALFLLLYLGWMLVQLAHDSAFRDASTHAAWLVLMLLLLCALLGLRRSARLRRAGLLGALALAALLDLFTGNQHTNFQPAAPEAQTAPPAILAPLLADHSVFRTYNEYRLPGNFGDSYGIADASGASPLRLARYEQFYKLPMERIWSLLNVQYVITWRKSLDDQGVQSEVVSEAKVSDTETTYVHRLLRVSPRAALVGQVDSASDEEALRRLAAPEFDFTRQAIIPAAPPASAFTGGGGTVSLLAQTPGRSTWSANAAGQSLLVLSENYYPGWRVFIDDREGQVLRADDILLAAIVPAGDHRVTFIFDPFSVKLGAGVSALTLLLLAGLAARGFVAARRH